MLRSLKPLIEKFIKSDGTKEIRHEIRAENGAVGPLVFTIKPGRTFFTVNFLTEYSAGYRDTIYIGGWPDIFNRKDSSKDADNLSSSPMETDDNLGGVAFTKETIHLNTTGSMEVSNIPLETIMKVRESTGARYIVNKMTTGVDVESFLGIK